MRRRCARGEGPGVEHGLDAMMVSQGGCLVVVQACVEGVLPRLEGGAQLLEVCNQRGCLVAMDGEKD